MKNVFEMRLKDNSNEELLEGLEPSFPYLNSKAFLDRYEVFWHWHQAVELFYVESGTVEYYTPQGTILFPSGSGGLVNSNVLHMTRPQRGTQNTVQLLHIFDASFLYGQIESRIYGKFFAPILSFPQLAVIPLFKGDTDENTVLEKLKSSFKMPQTDWDYELQLRGVLTDIWMHLLRLIPADMNTSKKSDDKLKQMLAFIHTHYTESIKAADIAAAGLVSERACYRAFQECLHISPMEYVTGCRLQAARKMLAEGNESVTQISQACGFGSSSFFGKVFRADIGITPTEFRRRWQDTTK